MSVVDPRSPELDFVLQSLRRRLNARIFLGRIALIWSVATPVATAVSVFLVPINDRWILVSVLMLIAMAGLVLVSKRHLSRSQAAAWLDEQKSTGGLFLAAVTCLDRAESGPWDSLVLEAASHVRPEFQGLDKIRFPRGRLLLRGGLALVATAVAFVLFELIPLHYSPLFRASVDSQPPSSVSNYPPEMSEPHEATAQSPHELALRLFPENERLAALAEQALVSGDATAIDSLLHQIAPTIEAARSAGALGRAEESPQTPGSQSSPATPETPGPATQPGQGRQGPHQPGPRPKGSPDSSLTTPSQGSLPKNPGTNPGAPDSSPSSGNENPEASRGGFGTGQSSRESQTLSKAQSSPELKIQDQYPSGFFELVMPETGEKVPLKQALAAQRSSETAQESTPLEYRSIIRDYFLALTQEAGP